MKVKAFGYDEFSSDQWSRQVDALNGNPLHLPGVYLADQSPGDLKLLVYSDGNETIACGPAISQAGSRNWLGRRERIFHLPTPPAAADAQARENTYACTLEYCIQSGYDRLSIGHTWGESFEGIEPLSDHVTDSVCEFVLDLNGDTDSVLAAMHKNHRKNIRRAGRAGLVMRSDSSLDSLLELRRLQLASADRAHTRGRGFAIRDAEYFRRVRDAVYGPGIGHVFFADLDGECVAALAYLTSGKSGITVRSGCTARGYETYAMYLLQFEVIKDALERGLERLNIGGVPSEAEIDDHPQHGLYEFKKGFGGPGFIRNAVSMKIRGRH